MGFLFPSLIAWLGWGDAKGGFVYAGVLRLVFVHHVSFWTTVILLCEADLRCSVDLLRQFSRSLARGDSLRRQAHAQRSYYYCIRYRW